MVSIPELWLPILVATVLVFAASSPRQAGPEAWVLSVPLGGMMAEMKDPAFVAKLNKGPVGLVTVMPSGPFNMGRAMGLWVGCSWWWVGVAERRFKAD